MDSEDQSEEEDNESVAHDSNQIFRSDGGAGAAAAEIPSPVVMQYSDTGG